MANGTAPKNQAGGVGPIVGEVLSTLGLLTAGAAIPGFAEGYINAQAREEAALQNRQRQLFSALQSNPELALLPGIAQEAQTLLGPEMTEFFAQSADQARVGREALALQQQFVNQQTAIEPIPITGRQGTAGLITPTGGAVIAGERGVRPPIKAGVEGNIERTVKFPAKGGVETIIGSAPSGELTRRGELEVRQEIRDLQDMFVRAGMDPAQAQAQAVQEVSFRGRQIPDDLRELREQAIVGVTPGTEAQPQPTVETFGQRKARTESEAARRNELARPPKAGRTFVNPQTLEIYPSQATLGQIESQGGIEVDAVTRRGLVSLREIDKLIADTDKITSTLFPSNDPQEIARRALIYKTPGFSRGASEEAVALRRLIALRARVPNLARTISGETGGRLSDFDVENVFAAIPGSPTGGLFEKFIESAQGREALITDMRGAAADLRRAMLGLPLERVQEAGQAGVPEGFVERTLPSGRRVFVPQSAVSGQ